MLMKCRGLDEGAWVCNCVLGSEAVTAPSQGCYLGVTKYQVTLLTLLPKSIAQELIPMVRFMGQCLC